jgi:hypothetical protein
MAAYVQVPTESDGDGGIVFEVQPVDVEVGPQLAGDDGRPLGRASQTVEESLGPIQRLLSATVRHVREADPPPDSVTVGLAVRFAGELGFVVAKGTAEASVMITATWSAPTRPS